MTVEHVSLTQGEWANVLSDILSKPKSVIIHTVILPPGFDRFSAAFKRAEIIEERSYKLKPGQIPDFAKKPAGIFDAHIEQNLIPKGRLIPENISVISGEYIKAKL